MKTETNTLLVLTAWALTVTHGFAQPVMTVQPADAIVEIGQTYINRVVASGTTPLAYQWYFNDQLLAGKTSSTISIPSIQSTNSGDYSVVVTNLYGSVTSRMASVFVGAIFTRITNGPFAEDVDPSVGSAWGDYDNDGRLDVLVVNRGTNYPDRLYRNLGGDDFVRVTNALTSLVTLDSWGAQWGDMDNDGDLDLFVPCHITKGPPYPQNVGRNEMFRNDGGGVFTPMTNEATSTFAFWNDATWVDHNGDGWLDIFATTDNKSAAGQSHVDYFFQNLSNGQFAAWTAEEVGVVVNPLQNTAGPTWCDIDADGDLDLYVSNYRGVANFLYRNDNGQLRPVTAGSLPAARSTWAAVWADFNNDGLFDLSTGGENGTNMLHLNRGNWRFEDATVNSGLALAGNVYSSAAGDFDNDGDLDLYVPVYDAADVLYINRGDATFDRSTLGSILTLATTNGTVWADYNNDGFLDLLQTCGDLAAAKNLLYRNSLPEDGNTNHWLKLRLKGTFSNASAIGARVSAWATIRGKETRQVRQVTTGCGAANPTDGMRPHFGLGDADRVETLRIEWPSGHVTEMHNVSANQILTIQEPPGVKFAGWDGGAMRIAITGHIGERYEVKTSTHVAASETNWVHCLNVTNTSRTMTVTDPSPNAPQRFYKAMPAK